MLCTLVVLIGYLISPLEVLSWGLLALMPVAREALPVLVACVLLGNLGASIAEVSKDALVAEYGQKNKIPALQSYAFTASATGGVLGNLLGGFCLMRVKQPMPMFLTFAALLALQLATIVMTKEESLGLPQTSISSVARGTILESIRKQCSDLVVVVRRDNISRPLLWIISSIVMVPVLSGSIFCYQTQCLNLDPSVIGMSKVTGQLILFVLTVLYDRFWKNLPMRKLVGVLQIVYASTVILDLILVKQVNLTLGIPNERFVFCFSAVAETLAQFKLLPFHVLFANLAPAGCEGSLMSFFTSALCLSSIMSGFLGVGLASVLGVTSGDYSNLPIGICIQFLAALLPLLWIDLVPNTETAVGKGTKLRRSKRNRRNRTGRRLAFDPIHHPYRQERAPDIRR
ncbi:OLC1v1019501C1 [Oldenlandia corymbosa var. corymbosa]|uniref:OLC1v1019501C1 n=1 Tax=Oldenlandia corymbosa var. corymbosa TaxID=529605 RepID=A0AAV1EE44_OLDCO|nr:OLC1v1019501C1 [Oldenlandia corymbosa var. corymbosa]